MYTQIFILFFSIVLVSDNHEYQFKPKTTWVVSQEADPFITSKNMKNSSINEFLSQLIGNFSPTTRNFNLNNVNWVAQKSVKDKNKFRILKKRGRNFSKGKENNN